MSLPRIAYRLDVLPVGCSIAAEWAPGFARVRFVAYDAETRPSEPSGWFDATDTIQLTWSSFWP